MSSQTETKDKSEVLAVDFGMIKQRKGPIADGHQFGAVYVQAP